MRNSKMRQNDAGLTLIELMFAAGVMAIGLVLMMQSIISLSNQAKVTDIRVAASHFSHGVLESIRGRDLSRTMQFNGDGLEFDLSEDGTMLLEGIGNVTVTIAALVTSDEGSVREIEIPLSDEALAALGDILPNPLEIQVEVKMDAGMGEGYEYKFRTSTLVYTL